MCKNCWDLSDDYEIQATNVPCGTSSGITCTYEAHVRVGSVSASLKRGHVVTVDGESISMFPYVTDGMSIDQPSSLQTMVEYNRLYS